MGPPSQPNPRPEPAGAGPKMGLACFAYAFAPATRYCLYRGSARRTNPARGKVPTTKRRPKSAGVATGYARIPGMTNTLTATLNTNQGPIKVQLFPDQAPETVRNFVELAEGSRKWTDPRTGAETREPLYNGTTFHRVIPDFMIQGGDPLGDGTGDPGYYFKDEFNPDLNFDVPGRLAMANSGPDTNGSQFFITEVPTEHLNQKHTIFGQCDEHSVLIVQSIARVERDGNDKPLQPLILKKLTIVPDGQPIPPSPASPTAAADAKPQT